MQRFPDDRGYSARNLREMKRFAESYPDFPFVQVPLAKLQGKTIWQAALAKLESHDGFIQVPLTQITWYHHISLLPKVKDVAERAFYIMATASEGWTRDTMLMQIANGYIQAKGNSINNFEHTLPPVQSDLARQAFKDPYKVDKWIKIILLERTRMIDAFGMLPSCKKVYPTNANFFLAEMDDAQATYDYLVRKGIIVRNRNKVALCANCLRITIGTKTENNELLAALRQRIG